MILVASALSSTLNVRTRRRKNFLICSKLWNVWPARWGRAADEKATCSISLLWPAMISSNPQRLSSSPIRHDHLIDNSSGHLANYTCPNIFQVPMSLSHRHPIPTISEVKPNVLHHAFLKLNLLHCRCHIPASRQNRNRRSVVYSNSWPVPRKTAPTSLFQ